MNQPVIGRRPVRRGGRRLFDRAERRGGEGRRRGGGALYNDADTRPGEGRGGGRGHGRPHRFEMGPGMGMGPGFGPRGRRRRRGDVRLAALLLIAEAPRNGYQIIQELAERTDGRWKPSSGAIYPALNQLEDEGLIRAVAGETGKVFEITDTGRAEAEAARNQPAPWEQAGGSADDPTHALSHGLRQVAQAVQVIAQSRDPKLIAQATTELDEMKRRLFQMLADAEG